MSINSRIRKLITIKEGGSQIKLASKLNVTPPYVAKLIKEGGSVGIEPIIKLLKIYPDLDARWLVLGEGDFIEESQIKQLKNLIHSKISDLLKIEEMIPYFTPDELREYTEATINLVSFNYTEEQYHKWENLKKHDNK